MQHDEQIFASNEHQSPLRSETDISLGSYVSVEAIVYKAIAVIQPFGFSPKDDSGKIIAVVRVQ